MSGLERRYTHQLVIRVDDDMRRALENLASSGERTVTQTVRLAIRRFVADEYYGDDS